MNRSSMIVCDNKKDNNDDHVDLDDDDDDKDDDDGDDDDDNSDCKLPLECPRPRPQVLTSPCPAGGSHFSLSKPPPCRRHHRHYTWDVMGWDALHS